ncbi:MAG: hypothetical protein ACOC1X_00520 [Promethearchaeota archaeon]
MQWFYDAIASAIVSGLLVLTTMAAVQGNWWYMFFFLGLFFFVRIKSKRRAKVKRVKDFFKKWNN